MLLWFQILGMVHDTIVFVPFFELIIDIIHYYSNDIVDLEGRINPSPSTTSH